ncbi:MAG: hypothetical protein PHD15_00500 [Clostridia bacterium]|nr:hypothetical protein [Clostridia bacterium]MDD4386231.1 hypothetical protein [Clostridia bacterium]
MILIIDKNKIELTAISRNVTTINDIKIKFNSSTIQDILSIAYINSRYINDMRENGTEGLLALKNRVLVLMGKKIKFIIKKEEFLELLYKEFNIEHELFLGAWNCKINNITVENQLYYNNGVIFEKTKESYLSEMVMHYSVTSTMDTYLNPYIDEKKNVINST